MTEETIQIPIRVQAETINQDNEQQVLELINRHTLEPFDSLEPIFTFSGNCSNDRMDSYMTKMDPLTTLRNYSEDLKTGVSLLEGHDITKNPYGRSYDGQLIPSDNSSSFNAVRGHWYILRDLNINGVNTNDTIRAIKSGIIRDMSVGFGGDQMYYRCSSCGRDMFDWECGHFPGLEDENGRMTFAWVVDAHLREVSTVYKGATPGATITPRAYIDKARQYVQQGQLSQKHIMKLENAYSIRLDDGNEHSFYLPHKKEDEEMPQQSARNNLLDDIRSAIRENKIEKSVVYDILTDEGDPFRQPDDVQLRNELGKDFCSVGAIRQLKKEAQQGRRYLADVIDQAVGARVKAQGEGFNADSYRQILSLSGDIDHIKEEIRSYEDLAKQKFTPGRQTETPKIPGSDEDVEPENKERIDPDSDNIFEGGK
ncbi:hypothetical protein OCO53_25365 [Peribacillus frigoritolerans]|uniref:hypothetical protein n=1 Tax=Peribacillus frigoritolerans TaxID=450367 RepID=UPI0021CEE19C|nr:hypothetical protein [Peribacillus frigoritolerans]MCU6603773.1 hypothetical protein [Peribacillus frigoritolerans]